MQNPEIQPSDNLEEETLSFDDYLIRILLEENVEALLKVSSEELEDPSGNKRNKPVYIEHLAFLGVEFERNRDYKTAKRCFKKIIEVDPKNIQSFVMLSIIACIEGDSQTAEKYLEQITKIDPENTDILNAIGRLYFKKNDMDKAREWGEKAKKINQRDTLSINNLGFLAFKQRDYETAIRYFAEALAINPNDYLANRTLELIAKIKASLLNNLNDAGSLMIEKGDFEAAESYTRRALTVDENDLKALSNLGIINKIVV